MPSCPASTRPSRHHSSDDACLPELRVPACARIVPRMQSEPGFQHQQESRSTALATTRLGTCRPLLLRGTRGRGRRECRSRCRPSLHACKSPSYRAQTNLPEISDLFAYWPGYAFGSSQPSRYHRSGQRRKSKSSSSSGPRSRAACVRPCQVLNHCSVVTTSSETLHLDGSHVGNEVEEVPVKVVVDALQFHAGLAVVVLYVIKLFPTLRASRDAATGRRQI